MPQVIEVETRRYQELVLKAAQIDRIFDELNGIAEEDLTTAEKNILRMIKEKSKR